MSATGIVAIIIVLFFPWLAMVLKDKVSVFDKIGPIVMCYAFGALMGNIGWSHGAEAIIKEITELSIPIAIPLFIYGTDFLGWLRHSKKTVISFLLCILSVTIISISTGLIFKSSVPEAWQISGMLAGVYTGGTPNLTAIGQSLEVASETIILVNSIDMLSGAILLFILLFFGNRFLRGFLPVLELKEEDKIEHIDVSKVEMKKIIKGGCIGTGLSLLSLGTSFGASLLFFKSLSVPFLIFMITTFGILLSFNSKIRNLNGPFEFGHYLLMVFCVGIGSQANVQEMFSKTGAVMQMCLIVVFGSVILHYLLCKIFKIDRDTAVITSVAGIFWASLCPSHCRSL
jgi:uncharacterized membrane protein